MHFVDLNTFHSVHVWNSTIQHDGGRQRAMTKRQDIFLIISLKRNE